ncbi:MAG: hypothetical protein OEU46_01720 [Alphaproteobacteria bacterium]|nr:hypothetical protein [Alphaproteobacteria bacterium]
MIRRKSTVILAIAAFLVVSTVVVLNEVRSSSWQEEFGISKCNLVTTGRNQYFIMEPGFQLVLTGDDTKLQITVLDETRMVDGVATRVIEEREWQDGALYEISRNFFAMCEETKDVFYFGEEVDFYQNGKVVKHDGSWLAGTNGNKAGLIMSGAPKVGMKYYQEIAPDVAMDRAEVISLNETCKTPAGTFAKCLKVKEGTALNFLETEYKYYAPEIGLIGDADLRLIRHGFAKKS